MTKSQVNSVARAFNTNYANIPGLEEWRDNYKKLSKEEKLNGLRMRDNTVSSWHDSQLEMILTVGQKQRLSELLVQMQGPAIVLVDSNVVETLHLSSEQLNNIRTIMQADEGEMEPFLKRYGHTMLQKDRCSQTDTEFEGEQDALAIVLTEMLKGRDEDILSAFTDAQRKEFIRLEGVPLRIRWPEHAFFYVPFHKE